MKSPTDSETSGAPTPTAQEKKLNNALDAMAKDVASTLENQSVRSLVKNQTGELLAGQHNVLFQTLADEKVKGLAKSGQSTTFEQVLAQERAGSAKSGTSLKSALTSVRKDAETIPKFDIGVPVHHEKWDPKTTTPLVAFHHRQEIDDTKLKRIKAYDAEGNVHWLDAQETPEQPIVVVGVNERTTNDGEVRTMYRDLQPICASPRSKCSGGGSTGGSTGGGSTEDPREYGDNEYLKRIKITQDGEPPWKGDPEVVVSAKDENDGHLKTYRPEKRDGSDMTPWNNSDDKSWITHDVLFFKWTRNVGENYTMWAAWEYDSGNSISLNVTYRGQTYGFSTEYTDNSEKYGTQRVQFGIDEDQVFDLGGFKFELESKNP